VQYIVAATVRYARLKGYKKLGVIDATDATGQASDRMLALALALPENKDVKIVDNEHFNQSDISVAAQIARTQYKAFLPSDLVFNALLYYGRDRLPKGRLKAAVDAFWDAYAQNGEHMTPGSGFAWDPVWITVSAIRKLGTNVTAQQLHDYLMNLHDFDGVDGTYDYRINDQHGLSDKNVIFVRWDANSGTFSQVSGPSGIPL
jgi:hypothetical protein